MKKSERYQHDKTATCKKFYFIGSVLGNRVLTEKTGYHSSDGSALQSAINMQSLFETYKGHVMYPRERILFRLFQGPVKRIRIFLKPHFFTQIGLYTPHETSAHFSTLHDYCKRSFKYTVFGKFKLLKVLSDTVTGVFKVIPW